MPFERLSAAGRSNALQRLIELTGWTDSLKVDLIAAIAGPPPVSESARRDDLSPEARELHPLARAMAGPARPGLDRTRSRIAA